jgi:hypothetical protein
MEMRVASDFWTSCKVESAFVAGVPLRYFLCRRFWGEIAQKDQWSFSKEAGRLVPVIRASSTEDGSYSFSYSPEDRKVQA